MSAGIAQPVQAERFGDRIPVVVGGGGGGGRRGGGGGGGGRFSAPVKTGPVAHPPSCTIDTRSLSRGVKPSGSGFDHPPYLAPWSKKEKSFPSGPTWPVTG